MNLNQPVDICAVQIEYIKGISSKDTCSVPLMYVYTSSRLTHASGKPQLCAGELALVFLIRRRVGGIHKASHFLFSQKI